MAALNVIIPPGMKPGQEIQAQSPDGTLAPWSTDVPAVCGGFCWHVLACNLLFVYIYSGDYRQGFLIFLASAV